MYNEFVYVNQFVTVEKVQFVTVEKLQFVTVEKVQFITVEKVSEWSANKTSTATRWTEMVPHFDVSHAPFPNVLKLAEFLFSFSGTNATNEKAFSAGT